ncbi:MAG: hypothetical protein WB995_14515 [Candidatus Acidiferrales bacterium]
MSPRTVFLSRLIGLYAIVVSLCMAAHKQSTVETITALVHNSPLVFLTGILAVVAGLAIILGHNVWSGGALPVIVTLIGWVTLVKGALLLILTPEAESRFFLAGLHYEQLFYFYVAIDLLLGVYLTYGGIRSTAR